MVGETVTHIRFGEGRVWVYMGTVLVYLSPCKPGALRLVENGDAIYHIINEYDRHNVMERV